MPCRICTHPWEYRAEAFRIAGNLYYVGNRDVSSHLIDTAEGLILLDTGFPQTAYLLLESIRRMGFDPDHIVWILHNHAHYDHMGGTRALVELTGAKTALGKHDVEILTDRPELSWAPEYGMEFYETFEVDRPLSDGDSLAFGDTRIQCIHIPGHTPGSISYFFEILEGARKYRVGIHGGPGLNTLTDEYLERYRLSLGKRTDYMRSLERLKREAVDIFIGAHPAQNQTFEKHARRTPGHNPFINPNDWDCFLAALDKNARATFGLPEDESSR